MRRACSGHCRSRQSRQPVSIAFVSGRLSLFALEVLLRRLVLVVSLIAALLVPTAASAQVRLVSVTSPVRHGGYATLSAAVSPARSCSMAVIYKSGASEAAGLFPKRPAAGRVSWTWKVGTRTTPGRWPIVVTCGSAGTLRTSITVA
jgi:hypothetical protein